MEAVCDYEKITTLLIVDGKRNRLVAKLVGMTPGEMAAVREYLRTREFDESKYYRYVAIGFNAEGRRELCAFADNAAAARILASFGAHNTTMGLLVS